ncbi:MAG: TrmH family RNA methyltransferase, partial [Ruminococcus sp.]
VDFKSPCITVIGNEGNGLKQETINACENKITIPMRGKAESLNASAAASIIIWEMIK